MTQLVDAPEYRVIGKLYAYMGLIHTFIMVYPRLKGVDLRKQAIRLEVPIYLATGRHDPNAMASLTEHYCTVLEAPHKELIWFEHSGHSPGFEEAGTFNNLMVDKVLAETSVRP
jgi:pimeloyl-ACP methyl ester carboxylesterase